MIKIIRTLNLNRETTAILENANAISYEKQVNSFWKASFSLPLNDPKANKVELLRYVEIDDVGLFRIIPKETSKSANTVTFQCEHVLSTLLNSTLFKYHQLTNYTTREVLEYLLSLQKNKHWQLGTVAFTRYFHYSWENENLLSAIFSVPEPFDEQFRWTWDTTSYPWTLNLVQAETEPTGRIKEGHNLVDFTVEENPMSVYNRIYPLGAGEGVNQLGIEDVNNGVPYIEDIGDEEIMETVWVDKRYEDAETLKSAAESLLTKWKKPIVTWTATAADVSSITGSKIDELKEGKVIRLDVDDFPVTDLRIMNESKSDLTGDPGNVQLQIGNVQEDIGTTQTDMERRQQINDLYSQGATNILSFNYQDNCDNNIPALIPFYVDDDVVNVNTVELTYRTKPFRAYSRATRGGGAVVDTTSAGGGTTKTTASGGGSTQTSSSGGGTSRSTNSGGGSTQTSSGGGNHRHTMFQTTGDSGAQSGPYISATGYQGVGFTLGPGTPRQTNIETTGASGSHNHSVSTPNHSHEFSTPNHAHVVDIPNHSHEFSIDPHTHEITLPNHSHEVEHEIIELDSTPSSVTIIVDGNEVPHTSNSGDRINLADYMSKDNNGKITRGRHEVEILPNGLARIEADLILRVFIQSRLGEVF